MLCILASYAYSSRLSLQQRSPATPENSAAGPIGTTSAQRIASSKFSKPVSDDQRVIGLDSTNRCTRIPGCPFRIEGGSNEQIVSSGDLGVVDQTSQDAAQPSAHVGVDGSKDICFAVLEVPKPSSQGPAQIPSDRSHASTLRTPGLLANRLSLALLLLS